MQVVVDRTSRRVILSGADGAYEARLTYLQCRALIRALEDASRAIAPPPPDGRTFEVAVGRWG